MLQGVLPAGRGDGQQQRPLAGAGTPGHTGEGAAVSAATAQQALAGKNALVLCTHRGIAEKFGIGYCSKAYKIRSLAGIEVTPL